MGQATFILPFYILCFLLLNFLIYMLENLEMEKSVQN